MILGKDASTLLARYSGQGCQEPHVMTQLMSMPAEVPQHIGMDTELPKARAK